MNLAKTGYIVSDATLTELSRDFVKGIDQADGVRASYLKILVAHVQRALDKWQIKRASAEKVLDAIDEVHGHLYAVVLEAVTTKDLLPEDGIPQEERTRRSLERNRRSTFARSAKSTLVQWVNAGGRISTLKPADVTKEELRKLYAQPSGSQDTGTVQERITTTETRLETLVKELAADDIEAASELVTEIVAKLQAIVDGETKTRPLTKRKRRVGELTLHPH